MDDVYQAEQPSWEEYERRKQELQKQKMPPSEYEKAIRELIDELNI